MGGADPLNTRLQNGELAPERAAVLLAGVAQDDAEWPLPHWVHTLESILDRGVDEREALGDRSFDAAMPLPFQEVLVDFVRHARDRFRAQAGSAAAVLSLAAAIALESHLLNHLTFVASLTIGRDFYEFRFARAPASAFESAWRRQAPSTDIYSAYVGHMRSGGLVALLRAHPVLARLLCQSVDQWASATADFCRRFEDDFADLHKTFDWEIERPDGAIADLRTGLSDPHYGGRSVIDCTLRTGEHVIYKPRTVEPEVVFYRFIGWLNRRTLSLALRELRALDRNTHGWVECVAALGCSSREEVERFYRRAGMLLAVLHALAITDIHCENVIASGEHPMIVDLESLLDDPNGESPDGEPSVLSTGMLPRWQTRGEGHRFDMSALGADAAQDSGIRCPQWKAVNTDQMTVTEDVVPTVSTTHRVRLDDELPTVSDYLQAFRDGFREVYSCLHGNRDRLMADARMLQAFDDLELRTLVRNTATYAGLQLHLLHPEFMENGLDRSIELEWLARPLSGETKSPGARALLYESERSAMENLDIPHFSTSMWRNLDHLSDDPDFLRLCRRRDVGVLQRRLAQLSPSDCDQQLAIVQEAVDGRFATR